MWGKEGLEVFLNRRCRKTWGQGVPVFLADTQRMGGWKRGTGRVDLERITGRGRKTPLLGIQREM